MGKSNDATGVFELIDMRAGDVCWPWLGGWGGRPRDRRPVFQYNGRRTQAYRIVFELVTGTKLMRSQIIKHSCDRGAYPVGCCNPKHISVGTPKENSSEMMHRQRFGLPHMVVNNIRKLLSDHRTQHEIAELYGVSRETVSAIATGRTYNDVTQQ